MRKLTGYIGAMIIVFALMGSILAGYALNINGTNTVMNEYEKVTDVSGLYTHTQEPTYIEYNPASNYTGYNYYKQYNSDVGNDTYKVIESGTLYFANDGKITLGGSFIGDISNVATMRIPFISDGLSMEFNPFGTGNYYLTGLDFYYTIATDLTITISGTTTTVIVNGNTYTYPNVAKNICYWTIDNTFDYYKLNGRLAGNNNNVYCYINELTDLYTYSKSVPNLTPMNPNNDVSSIITRGYYYWTGQQSGVLDNAGPTAPTWGPFVNHEYVDTNVYRVMANYTQWIGSVWYNNQHNPLTLDGYSIFYPRTVNNGGGVGINYTESNRVNNYLINTEPANTIKISSKIDLMSISAADQWDTPGNLLAATTIANHSTPPYPTWSFFTPNYTNQYGGGNAAVKNDIVIYKLSDILSTYTIPNGTQTVKIDFNSTDTRPYTFYGNTWYLDGNVAFFQKLTEPYNYYENKNIANEKLYGVYDPSTNLVSVYQPNGILEYTETPDNIGVLFVKPNQIYGRFQYSESVNGNFYTDPYTMANRQNPFMTITSSVYNPANNHYMDIAKGISIKSTNDTDTYWNNEYSNGIIQLLFRAETTPGTYHNTLTIEDNVISVDYNTNKYLVTLNGADPVDIGTWRNIVLNVDLINGELSAIPVRTFNSYTKVELDNTNIFIGNLVNAAPTNTIKWAPTTNSLTFNVYSTSVFMNTYGVVMVDPTLNITDYFTTLNNFYQLRLSNFSMYGQSMTINGVTGTVTGNTISFNDETIQIKDMAITYADGNVTISDSYATIDLGAITDNNISMTGAWYFISELYNGYTVQKTVYDWDWGAFILDDKSFGVIYIGLCLIGLIVARKFCSLTITDYLIFMVSIVIALTLPVIV